MSHIDDASVDARTALVRDGARVMTICNACRYCEGYCAVFPAMERRLEFAAGDLNYLANLCHGCGECYFACQYAPPHEFDVNVPRLLAQIRVQSYRDYAWLRPIAKAFNRNSIGTIVFSVVSIAVAVLLVTAILGRNALFASVTNGDFYKVVPHLVMATLFGAAGLFSLLAIVMGCARAWRDMGESTGDLAKPFAWKDALAAAFTLKYLSGDSAGCSTTDTHRSSARWWAHHVTFYGFLLCFAATTVASIYHYGFGWKAPYGYASLPVLLGVVGGIGLLIGPPLLYRQRRRMDQALLDTAQAGIANALIALLFLSSLTGLLLLAFRDTRAMAALLMIHLAVVLTLFVTFPYGKFIHGFYRFCALLKYALEDRRPTNRIGEEDG